MGAAKPKGTVGIVGLGIMGGAFARNLLADGWRVLGHDIDPARRRALARAGVVIAADTDRLSGEARTLITTLPSPAARQATLAALVGARLPPHVIRGTRTL